MKTFKMKTLIYLSLLTGLLSSWISTPIDGVYYLRNSNNKPDYENYFAFDKNGTFQQNSTSLFGVSIHLKGRYEVDNARNRIYIFGNGKPDTLKFLNGHVIFANSVYIKGSPANAKYLNSKSMLNESDKDRKELLKFYDSLKLASSKKKPITYETPYGDINPRDDNDEDLRNINDDFFNWLGVTGPLQSLPNNLNKDPNLISSYENASSIGNTKKDE